MTFGAASAMGVEMVYVVIITHYHTSTPETAVHVKFHLMGKFETDTCPTPIPIIPQGMITSFITYAVTFSPLAMVKKAEQRTYPNYPIYPFFH